MISTGDLSRATNNLLALVYAFRLALERLPHKFRTVQLHDFPNGSCGDATYLLGTFLKEQGLGNFEYVVGEKRLGNRHLSHAWLQRGRLLIDITADQFDDEQESVIITEESAWHTEWEPDERNAADYRILTGFGSFGMDVAYRAALMLIEPSVLSKTNLTMRASAQQALLRDASDSA